MEEKMTPQEWEARVIEKISQIDEVELLKMAQVIATLLAAELIAAISISKDPETTSEDVCEQICGMAGRMAIYLDALQMSRCSTTCLTVVHRMFK